MTENIAAQTLIRRLLRSYGIDPNDPLLADTPRRVVEAHEELFSGVTQDEAAPLKKGDPVPPGIELVTLRRLEFRSICAHHLLPFSGVVSVAYVPAERIVGIGAIVRCLEILSTRPQLQETLSQQIADAICDGANAAGALVLTEARHSCIADRGPREAASSLVVVAAAGALRDPARRGDALLSLGAVPGAGVALAE